MELIHLGNDQLHSPFKHIWPNTEFKHLGIPLISTGISVLGLEKKVDTILASSFLTPDFWHSHGCGAIIALNTFLMSHCIHLLSATRLPVILLQKIHLFCYNFCVKHAINHIAYDKIGHPTLHGGVGLIHIFDLAYSVSGKWWVSIFSGDYHPWKHQAYHLMQCILPSTWWYHHQSLCHSPYIPSIWMDRCNALRYLHGSFLPFCILDSNDVYSVKNTCSFLENQCFSNNPINISEIIPSVDQKNYDN